MENVTKIRQKKLVPGGEFLKDLDRGGCKVANLVDNGHQR